jgi:hypothetical protein
MSINASAPIPASSASSGTAVASNKTNPLLETGKGKSEDHFSFWDLLDVVNPLQHIPIVSNIYRSITGDQINNAARVAGDALYGGVIGAAFGVANAIAVHTAGDDIGGVAMSKMGLLKSQEQAQASTQAKTDTVDPTANTASDLKNLPVVEVHPAQKADANDEIKWDQPQQVAEAQPVAMPTPKELNNIEPANGDTAASEVPRAPIDKADIPKNIMDGLNKYQAMHKVDADSTGMIQPKNIFAMPASAPTTNVAQNNTVAAAKKSTAAFNKLRHF